MKKTKYLPYKVGQPFLFDGIPHTVRHVNAGKAWLSVAFGDNRHVATVCLDENRLCTKTGRKAQKV